MTKMLVSDFDDTIKTSSKYITNLNVMSLKKFRENGNKLVIASGRNFTSLEKELSNCNLEYDALICNDGAISFNKDNQVIFGNYFNNVELECLLHFLKIAGKKYINDISLYNEYECSCNNDKIIELVVIANIFKNIKPIMEEMLKYFHDIQISKSGLIIRIKKITSKGDAIDKIYKYFDIKKEDIYTIGDWTNDYEMIRDYNGYNILFGHPSLRKVSKGNITTVAQLVKKIN